MSSLLSGIMFWLKDSGNHMSHSKGLTKEQVDMLQSLKEGDRLILWGNPRKKETDSSLTLKVYRKAEEI